MNEKDKQAEPVADHSGLIKRIDAAIERVTQGRGLMSIPADPRSDVDLVLSECKALLQGENPPFWAADFHPAPAVAQEPVAFIKDLSVPKFNQLVHGDGPWKGPYKMDDPLYTEAPAVADFSDAYQGAREDLAIWKKRALEAEELNRKFIADINGHTFMGEPVPAAAINEETKQEILRLTNLLIDQLHRAGPAIGTNLVNVYCGRILAHLTARMADFQNFNRRVIDPVLNELEKATTKFPTWPTDPIHALAVLGEEFGELTQAVLQCTYEPHKSNGDDVRTEAIQTAAMAIRFLASLDEYEYNPGEQHSQAEAAKGGGVMLTNPKFDLKLVATRRNGEQLELVRSFTLNDAETRGGLFCEIGRAAIGLYDDLERFVADEKARERI